MTSSMIYRGVSYSFTVEEKDYSETPRSAWRVIKRGLSSSESAEEWVVSHGGFWPDHNRQRRIRPIRVTRG